MRVPVIRNLKEGAPRQGFFEREQYDAVRQHLRPDLQVALSLAYTYGWRVKSEILTLERRQVDLVAGTLRLESGTTTNDDGRVVYLTTGLKSLLTAQVERVKTLELGLGRIYPLPIRAFTGRDPPGGTDQRLQESVEGSLSEGGMSCDASP